MDAKLVKKRGKKVTQEQKEIIVNFLETNNLLIFAKIATQDQQFVDDKWQELKTTLNSVENGAKKELSMWKSTIADWKCKAKKLARLNKEGFKKTGGGGYSYNEQLSDLDNRLIRLFGLVAVLGCDEIPPEINPEEADIFLRGQCLTPPPPTTSSGANSECNNTPDIEESISCMRNGKEIKDLKVKRGRIHKPTKRNVNSINKLAASADKHLEASIHIAKSIDKLGSSVGELASAFNKIAEAIVVLATAKEFSSS